MAGTACLSMHCLLSSDMTSLLHNFWQHCGLVSEGIASVYRSNSFRSLYHMLCDTPQHVQTSQPM